MAIAGLCGQLDNDMHDAGDSLAKSDLAQRKQTIPIAVARATATIAAAFGDAVWHGGIQLAYALVHAELARAHEALEGSRRPAPTRPSREPPCACCCGARPAAAGDAA